MKVVWLVSFIASTSASIVQTSLRGSGYNDFPPPCLPTTFSSFPSLFAICESFLPLPCPPFLIPGLCPAPPTDVPFALTKMHSKWTE